MPASASERTEELLQWLDHCASHDPEKLANRLKLKGPAREEGVRLFKELLDLLNEVRLLSLNRLPDKLIRKVRPVIHSAEDVLDQAESFSVPSSKAVFQLERCKLLERTRRVYQEIQSALICPDFS